MEFVNCILALVSTQLLTGGAQGRLVDIKASPMLRRYLAEEACL